MKWKILEEILEKLAPPECACDWDNSGLLTGREEKEVKRVFLALDATCSVIEEAAQWRADLLLTHHPLIFKPLKKVNDSDFIAKRVMELIRRDISCYAMHTNFDSAPGCMADTAADKLGLSDLKVLSPMGAIFQKGKELSYGIGKTGYLTEEMTVREAAALVKERFGLPFLTVYGDLDSRVRLLGISPGSGRSVVEPARQLGVQVLVTGDMDYHSGIDSGAEGMCILDAGHYGLEYLFLDFMEEFLKNVAGGELEICKAKVEFPQTLIV